MKFDNYVITHKDTFIPDNKYLIPIQVGACAHEHISGYLHDDQGDNISSLNKDYCELTGMYWIWKNGNTKADYIGISHYRRYICLNKNYAHLFFTHWKRYYIINSLTDKTFSKLGYEKSFIEKLLINTDIIIPECSDCLERGMKNFYELYINTGRKEILDYILNCLIQKYPEYLEASDIVKNSSKGYHCNIFIMRADLYNEYCSWLFDILDQIYIEYNNGKISPGEDRFIGYYAEYLTGIYFVKCQLDGKKVIEYPAVFFKNCDGKEHIIENAITGIASKVYRLIVPINSRRERWVYKTKDKVRGE